MPLICLNYQGTRYICLNQAQTHPPTIFFFENPLTQYLSTAMHTWWGGREAKLFAAAGAGAEVAWSARERPAPAGPRAEEAQRGGAGKPGQIPRRAPMGRGERGRPAWIGTPSQFGGSGGGCLEHHGDALLSCEGWDTDDPQKNKIFFPLFYAVSSQTFPILIFFVACGGRDKSQKDGGGGVCALRPTGRNVTRL